MPQHIKIHVSRKTLFEDSFQQVSAYWTCTSLPISPHTVICGSQHGLFLKSSPSLLCRSWVFTLKTCGGDSGSSSPGKRGWTTEEWPGTLPAPLQQPVTSHIASYLSLLSKVITRRDWIIAELWIRNISSPCFGIYWSAWISLRRVSHFWLACRVQRSHNALSWKNTSQIWRTQNRIADGHKTTGAISPERSPFKWGARPSS